MIPMYEPFDWYWCVAGDETRFWSSAAGAYVSEADQNKLTRIGSAAALNDVLRPYGLELPEPSEADYANAIQAYVDRVAVDRGYESGIALASYVNSTIDQWATEARTFIAWRDQTWAYAFQLLQGVQAGQVPTPTVSGVIDSLPKIEWTD